MKLEAVNRLIFRPLKCQSSTPRSGASRGAVERRDAPTEPARTSAEGAGDERTLRRPTLRLLSAENRRAPRLPPDLPARLQLLPDLLHQSQLLPCRTRRTIRKSRRQWFRGPQLDSRSRRSDGGGCRNDGGKAPSEIAKAEFTKRPEDEQLGMSSCWCSGRLADSAFADLRGCRFLPPVPVTSVPSCIAPGVELGCSIATPRIFNSLYTFHRHAGRGRNGREARGAVEEDDLPGHHHPSPERLPRPQRPKGTRRQHRHPRSQRARHKRPPG